MVIASVVVSVVACATCVTGVASSSSCSTTGVSVVVCVVVGVGVGVAVEVTSTTSGATSSGMGVVASLTDVLVVLSAVVEISRRAAVLGSAVDGVVVVMVIWLGWVTVVC